MRPGLLQSLLRQSLTESVETRRHLNYSFEQVKELPDDLAGATEAQLESVEAFTSRFARSVDLSLYSRSSRISRAINFSFPPSAIRFFR